MPGFSGENRRDRSHEQNNEYRVTEKKAMEPHYTFHIELQNLNKKLLHLTALVEDRVRKATQVIETKDEEQLQSIILLDYEVDDMEVEIEEDCLKTLALHQPVAGDLRFIIAVIKINNELERIADMAVNICIAVETIARSKAKNLVAGIDFAPMSEKVIDMLKMSLDALIKRDPGIARRVFLLDDEVDEDRNKIFSEVKELIRKHPENPGGMINTYLIAMHLERIGDRACNICEEVIYLVEGTVTRSNI